MGFRGTGSEMNQDQLRAKSLALFHALVSNWANDLRKEVTGLQDELLQKLDALQERMSKYEENIDENRILAFANEAVSLVGSGGGGGDTLKTVRTSLAKLNEGTSLTEVLTLLLEQLSQFAPRVAIFILKGGSCIGWNGKGFDQSPGFNNEGIKRISVPTSANTVFSDVINSRKSFVGASNNHPDNVQLLSRIGNVLPSNIFATPLILRERIAALVYADSGDGSHQLQDSEALEILTAYASKLLDALSAQKSPVKTGEHLPPPAAPSPPPAPSPAEPVQEEESGTVMFSSAEMNVSSFSASGASAGSAPTAAAAGGPNLDSMDSDTRKKHEEAMRFARLLVSEIKLYNEAKVQQGRSNNGIYNLMRDDIERSRQLYKERVPEPVRSSTNYFNDELIRILADGDSGAMGQLPAG
ncbi:MAG: hypothetical protein BMS9Abin37_1884 [Acidobacteriota bacterium]|nr:MAG: hypothetical protein BMS9Abin37_1884 [Acidobacteriota bacterium]